MKKFLVSNPLYLFLKLPVLTKERMVIIEHIWESPKVTKDIVTVANISRINIKILDLNLFKMLPITQMKNLGMILSKAMVLVFGHNWWRC